MINISNLAGITKSPSTFFPLRNALSLLPLSSCHSQVIKARTTFTVLLSPKQGNTIRRSLFIQAHVGLVGRCLTFVCFSPAAQKWWVCVSWGAYRPNLHTMCLDDCVLSTQVQQITAQSFLLLPIFNEAINLLISQHPTTYGAAAVFTIAQTLSYCSWQHFSVDF